MTILDRSIVAIPEEVKSFKDVYGRIHENLQDALARNKLYAMTYFLDKNLVMRDLNPDELATFLTDNAKWIKEYLP